MTQMARKVEPSVPAAPPQARKLPPLQNGDHLTRVEFERRWEAMPDLQWAELIEGRVYLSPPISITGHSGPHLLFGGILMTYWAGTPGVFAGGPGSVRLDNENMPIPDVYLMIKQSHGGQAKIDSDDYLSGAPELVVEIAASTSSYDLHEKRRLYQRSTVREYVVWRTLDSQIDYFILRDSGYEPLRSLDGIYRSEIFPGLWIDANALLAGDPAKALAEVQKGLASPEHAAFVEALKSKAAR
jgi:Uma2 family endonuclease